MTDETVHIQPAIPSRAATAQLQNQSPGAFLDQPSPGTAPTKKSRAGTGAKAALTREKNERLRAAEIRKINIKRAAALKAAKKNVKKRIIAEPARKKRKAQSFDRNHLHRDRAKAMATKNPNRPLEMKNQLSAVLSMVGTLQKAELVFFSQAVPAMQALSRSGRKRVIAALQQVYG